VNQVIVDQEFNSVIIEQKFNSVKIEKVDVETIVHFLSPVQPVHVDQEVVK